MTATATATRSTATVTTVTVTTTTVTTATSELTVCHSCWYHLDAATADTPDVLSRWGMYHPLGPGDLSPWMLADLFAAHQIGSRIEILSDTPCDPGTVCPGCGKDEWPSRTYAVRWTE